MKKRKQKKRILRAANKVVHSLDARCDELKDNIKQLRKELSYLKNSVDYLKLRINQ